MVVLVVLALAACNGDDDTASTSIASTTDGATSTEAPPSTSEPQDATTVPTTAVLTAETTTTTPPTTTSESPTTTDTTAPPSTSDPDVDEAVQARVDVVETVRSAYQASLDVVRDPANDSKRDALADYFVAPLLDGWLNIVERYRTEGLRELENPEEPDSFDAELASLAVNDALDFATIQGCSVTSGIIVEVGGNADGSDRVIEDRVSRAVVEFEVRRDGDAWKVASVREPEESERVASCG